MPISEKKLLRGTAEETKMLNFSLESRQFHGTENALNSIPNHSEAEKKARNSVPNPSQKRKPFGNRHQDKDSE